MALNASSKVDNEAYEILGSSKLPTDGHPLQIAPLKDQVKHLESQISLDSDHAVPEGGWGWVCVGACFAVNAFTWGVVAVCLSLAFFTFATT